MKSESILAIREANLETFVPEEKQEWARRVAARRKVAEASSKSVPESDGEGTSQTAQAEPESEPEFAVLGVNIGLTILVQFPDDTATGTSDPINFPTTQAKVIRYCNEVGYNDDGNTGSVRDYFYDQSEGMLTYTQVVTSVITLPKARNEYNFSDYPTNATLRGSGAAGRMVVADAVAILESNNFDFSALSVNSSNQILATNVLFAGPTSGVWSEGLWPHRSSVSQINVGTTQNPMYVRGYQITNANAASIKIGTFCHENGHLLLGLPDLYDYGGESSGAGRHALMGSGNQLNGGRTPAPLNAYFKDVSGWASVTDLNSSSYLEATLPSTGNVAYRFLKPGTSSEYFIVENRGTGDPWAASVPDKGVFIWHIDETVNGNNNEQMTEAQHYEVSVEQADGDFDLENKNNSGDSSDLFDASTGPFDDTTSPDAKWWDGANSGIYIEALDSPGATMRVQFGNQPPNTITLESPAPGDLLTNFGTHYIKWAATIPDNVRIELYKGGVFHSTIVSSTANDGIYGWQTPVSLAEGTDYTVRVSSVANQSIDIFSAGPFEIEHVLFSDGFESGNFQNSWALSGTNSRRNIVTDDKEPFSGDWHATLDASSGTFSRNEMTLTVDIEEGENVILEFQAKEFNDAPNGPPSIPFNGGANFDGVAISANGTTWYEVQPLRNEMTATWKEFTVDLDAAMATHGLSYTRNFKIRFNHYGNAAIPNDGFAFDEVKIFGQINRTTTLTLNPASDTGASNSDRVTMNSRPFFTGSTRAGLDLVITSDRDGNIGTFNSGGTGNWSFRPASALSDGLHNITVTGEAASVPLAVTIDTNAPGSTLNKAGGQADPANAGPVRFTAVFSEPVSDFAAAEVSVSGTVAGNVSLSGGPSTYTATVATTGGDGTVIATIPAGVAVDLAGNANGASTSNDNYVVVDGHGNGAGQATPFQLTNNSGSDTGWLISGDADSFSFSLTEPKRVEITTISNINTIGALFDSSDNLINNPNADDDAGADRNFFITRVLPPGDYSVELTSAGISQDREYIVTIDLAEPPLLINEVDAFTFDDTEMEFIELYDGGRGNLSLDGKVLVFFEGVTDTSYYAIDLDGLTTDAQGYLVFGSDDLPQTVVTIADGLLEDGAGAVAIYDADASDFPNGTAPSTTNLLDAVVYRPDGAVDDTGLAPFLIPNNPHLAESTNGFPVGQSLQRIPNGIGELRSGDNFLAVAPTPGAPNDFPEAPFSVDLLASDDLGISNTDNFTSVIQPRFVGIATPGAIVRIRSSHEGEIGVVYTARDGSFTIENHGVNFRGTTHDVTAENVSNSAVSSPLTVTVDNRRPAVTVNQAASQSDPVTEGPILFEVIFDEDVHGFESNDIEFLSTLSGPLTISGGPSIYQVSVGTNTDEGFLELTVSEGAAFDMAGNPTRVATHTDNAVTLDVHGASPASGATTVLLVDGFGTISGWVQAGDTDSFMINLSDPRKFIVSTTGGVDTYGRVMDMAGNVLNIPHLDDNQGSGENFWSSLTLEAGIYIVEITGRGQSSVGQYELEIDANTPPFVQPDLAVGLNATSATGNDIYNTADGQSMSLISYQASVKNGTVTIENDGEVTDDFIVSASPGNSVFGVQYSNWRDGNITAQLIAGTYRVEDIAPGEAAPPIVTVISPSSSAVRQVVTRKVKGKKKKGKKKRKTKKVTTVSWLSYAKTLTITAKSEIAEDQNDSVQLILRTK